MMFIVGAFVGLIVGVFGTLGVLLLIGSALNMDKLPELPRPEIDYCECDMHPNCKGCDRTGIEKCLHEGLYKGYKERSVNIAGLEKRSGTDAHRRG